MLIIDKVWIGPADSKVGHSLNVGREINRTAHNQFLNALFTVWYTSLQNEKRNASRKIIVGKIVHSTIELMVRIV